MANLETDGASSRDQYVPIDCVVTSFGTGLVSSERTPVRSSGNRSLLAGWTRRSIMDTPLKGLSAMGPPPPC